MPGASSLRDNQILQSMVKKQAADGRPYAAICASPAVALGSWGLLQGLKVYEAIYVTCTYIIVVIALRVC